MTNNRTVQGSFSIYVPKVTDSGDAEENGSDVPYAYFRIGGPSPYDQDGEPRDVDGETFGVHTFTDGNTTEVTSGSDDLSLKYGPGGGLTSAQFKYDSEGSESVKWSKSKATEVSISDKRAATFGNSSGVEFSQSQSVKVSSSFSLGLGVSVGAKIDPMSVSIDAGKFEIKTIVPDVTFSANQVDNDIRGLSKVVLTAAPHDAALMAKVQAVSIVYQAAAAAMALSSAALFVNKAHSIPDLSREDAQKEDEVKNSLKEMALRGEQVQAMLSTMQVAGMLLGVVGVIIKKSMKALDKLAAGQVAVSPLRAQMRVGPTSYIEVNPGSIVLNAPHIRIHGLQQMNTPVMQPPLPM